MFKRLAAWLMRFFRRPEPAAPAAVPEAHALAEPSLPDEQPEPLRSYRPLPPAIEIGNHVFKGALDLWQDYSRITLERAFEILTRDLPADTKAELTLHSNGKGKLSLEADAFKDSREFDLQRCEAYRGGLEVEEKGQGLGRLILRNQIEFFHVLGVDRFQIHAGWEAGGYTWARFGFLPDNIDSSHFEEYTRDPVQKRFKAISKLLRPKERRKIADLIDFNDPEDIWRLADRRRDIGPRLREVFAAAADTDSRQSKLAAAIGIAFRDDEDAYTYASDQLKSIKEMVAEQRRITIGRFLLAGTDWQGQLDMTNKTQMRRVGNYVGGWSDPELAQFVSKSKTPKP